MEQPPRQPGAPIPLPIPLPGIDTPPMGPARPAAGQAPPPPPTSPPAKPPAPASPSAAILAASESLRRSVSAYPGNITYIDLIQKNRRDSAVLIVAMILLGITLGGVIGGAISPYLVGLGLVGRGFEAAYDWPDESPMRQIDHAAARQDSMLSGETGMGTWQAPARVLGADPSVYRDVWNILPGALIGAGIALVLALTGTAWSWFSGARAILSMSGARHIYPEEDPQLYNIVDEMRLAAGVPMPQVYIIEDSALNAFATGRDPDHAAVAVTRGLRNTLNRDQLQAVIAHEVAHIRHYDIRFAMLMATMVGLIVFACDAFLRISFHGARMGGGGRAMRGGSSRGGGKGGGGGLAVVMILLAVLLSIIAPILARLIQMAYSRQREYLADAGAVELTRNPQALADALVTLANDPDPHVETANRGTAHMFIVNPAGKMAVSHQALDSAFSSHPPIRKRVARVLALLR